MAIEILEAVQVQTATKDLNDGGGLWLRFPRKEGAEPVFVFRYTAPSGKRREMAVGRVQRQSRALAGQSLTDARESARKARALLNRGDDPIDVRRAEDESRRAATKTKAAPTMTLAKVARAYHERVIESGLTARHAAQWIRSLEQHMPPELWTGKPIGDVTAQELRDFLLRLQLEKRETASRIRQRLELIFADAIFEGHCTANPAAPVRHKMREAMKGKKRKKVPFAALRYVRAPHFMHELRAREGIAARCFEFTILTAARTGEAVGARWDEIDAEAREWRIPGVRMKVGEPHTVFLSERAMAIVESMRGLDKTFVFPSPDLDGSHLSNMALLMTLRRMQYPEKTTVHGFRKCFSSWGNERGMASPDVIELCLAHKDPNNVRAVYNQAEHIEARRRLLDAWAEFLDGDEAKVVDLASRRAA